MATIRLFEPTDDGLNWTLVEEFDGGRRCPSGIIQKDGKWWHYCAAVTNRDENFGAGLCYVQTEAPTHY